MPYSLEEQNAVLVRHEAERAQLEHVERVAKKMDAAITIPGTSIPLGFDTIIGLVPGVGDTISLGIAGYITAHGVGLKVRRRHMAVMVWNIFVDWLIGLVPVIGDVFDIGWKGNLKNAALLRAILEKRWEQERLGIGIIDQPYGV